MAPNFKCRNPKLIIKQIIKTMKPSVLPESCLVNFNFSLEFIRFNWVQPPMVLWPSWWPPLTPEFTGKTISYTTLNYKKPLINPLSHIDITNSLTRVLTHMKDLSDDERQCVIECALDKLLETDPAGHFEISLDFKMVLEHEHVFSPDGNSPCTELPPEGSWVMSVENYEVGLRNIGEMSCTICFEDFSGDCKALCLPCNHLFHGDCINKWMRSSRCCPLCRIRIPATVPTLRTWILDLHPPS